MNERITIDGVEFRRDGLALYHKDTDANGYLKLARYLTANEALEMLADDLRLELGDDGHGPKGIDYITSSYDVKDVENSPLPKAHNVACYVVEGGSEGHYVHVDLIVNSTELRRVPADLDGGRTASYLANPPTAVGVALIKTFEGEAYAERIARVARHTFGACWNTYR